MDEKTMVNDILGSVKADLTAYQTAISESENMQLRQTIQQIRNNDRERECQDRFPAFPLCELHRPEERR